jgi:hypothetical protein
VRTVIATRYVTPLREGGSLPAIVEGDDFGLYVAKFRGAGQGPKALVAELITGELARAVGLRVPELVVLDVSPALGRNEPDEEIRDLLKASAGLNLGVDYLPGSITFDPIAEPAPDGEEASAIVWLDAFSTNVDRTPRNPNLLVWHRQLWLIDHGASLVFHHAWAGDAERAALSPFPAVKDHVLLPWAADVAGAGGRIAERLTRGALERAVNQIPDAWLETGGFAPAAEQRAAYLRYLERRLEVGEIFVKEAERARALLV